MLNFLLLISQAVSTFPEQRIECVTCNKIHDTPYTYFNTIDRPFYLLVQCYFKRMFDFLYPILMAATSSIFGNFYL